MKVSLEYRRLVGVVIMGRWWGFDRTSTNRRRVIRLICLRYHVRELSLFGSALRDDFSPTSDIDLLVEFDPEAKVSLFDFVSPRDELSALFGREVDLVEKRGLRNLTNQSACSLPIHIFSKYANKSSVMYITSLYIHPLCRQGCRQIK